MQNNKISKQEEQIRSVLQLHDIKITAPRVQILSIFLSNKKPLSYEMIRSFLPKSIDKATFYRNMTLFENKEIISSFKNIDRVCYYELHHKNHAHFVCEECQQITCIELDKSLEIGKSKINSITLKGVCEDCLNN